MARPYLLLALLVAGGLMLAQPGWSQADLDWPRPALEPVVGGLTHPIVLADPGDGSGRLLVAEKSGIVRVVAGGSASPVPFLDLTDRVASHGAEQGLIGLAFPPGRSPDHFYVDYTRGDRSVVISRFHKLGPDQADPGSEQVLLTIAKPYDNHNGGQLAFGPRDGYLYVGVGDGGEAGPADLDNHAQSLVGPDGSPMLLGKILRLDVESGVSGYGVPLTNPVMAGRRSEIWAMGLRNPWRFSFDRATADLYVGDVGQSQREEIDLQPASSGGGENYGWRFREGTSCFTPVLCDLPGLVPPIAEYTHDYSNCAVVGGYVYRGQRYPRMQGIYFYSDFCTGRIWGLARDAGGWHSAELQGPRFSASTFGEDADGELYLVDYGGWIYHLADPTGPAPTPTPDCATQGGPAPPAPGQQRIFLPVAPYGCRPS